MASFTEQANAQGRRSEHGADQQDQRGAVCPFLAAERTSYVRLELFSF